MLPFRFYCPISKLVFANPQYKKLSLQGKFLIDQTISFSFFLIVWRLLRPWFSQLKTSTDILGYPIHANYNIDWAFTSFYLLGIGAPLLGVFLFLCRNLSQIRTSHNTIDEGPGDSLLPEKNRVLASKLRTLITGLLISFCCVGLPSNLKEFYFPSFLLTTFFYYFISQKLVSNAIHRAVLNILICPLFLFSILGASTTTRRFVVSSSQVDFFPWLNQTFFWCLLGCSFGWCAYSAFKGLKDNQRLSELENRALWFVGGSTFLFLWKSGFVGVPDIDFFHHGESLAPAQLMAKGFFPWRDFLFIHGLFYDPFKSLFGFHLFENSLWGALAGEWIVLIPIYWLLMFWMGLLVFKNKAAALIGTFFFPLLGVLFFEVIHLRFILHPLIIMILYRLWDKPSALTAACFAGLSFASAVVTPESAFFLLSLASTLFFFEAIEFFRNGFGLRAFRRTLLVALFGLLALLAWLFFLHSNRALEPYLFYFRNFVGGHRYTGGIPVNLLYGNYFVATLFILGSSWLALTLVAIKIFKKTRLTSRDLIMLGLGIFNFLYFQKYLSRADAHIVHPFAGAVPLILIEFDILLSAWNSKICQSQKSWLLKLNKITFYPGSLLVFVFLTLLALPKILPNLFHFNEKFTSRIESDFPRLGSPLRAGLSLETQAVLDDWTGFKKAYMGDQDYILDFTNHLALFYYYLDILPPSRFINVSMALKRVAQQTLLNEVQPHLPLFAVFSAPYFYSWDNVPNQVRHYDVSEYILNRYKPFVVMNDYLVMTLREHNPPPPSSLGLAFKGTIREDSFFETPTLENCDWGFAPYHFSQRPDVRFQHPSVTKVPLRWLRSFKQNEEIVDEFEVPPGSPKGNWLEITFQDPQPDHISIRSSLVSSPKEKSSISFSTPGSKTMTYRLQVGSCFQWHHLTWMKLFVTHSKKQNFSHVTSVRIP